MTGPHPLIRREAPRDSLAVAGVLRAAFGSGGLDDPPELALVAALRTSDSWLRRLSLVAVISDEVIGHVLCTRGMVGAHRRPALALAPLAVDPDHQGRGVGSALMHAVIAAAEALDEPLMALLGDPSYYGRFGFRAGQEVGITPPEESWGKHFQVRLLANHSAELAGTFHYPPAFDQL